MATALQTEPAPGPLPPSTRGPIREGALQALTLAPGIVPIGLVFGATTVAAGFSPGAAIALSALVFAGGAQFAAVGLAATGAAALATTALVFLINSRYFLLSAAAIDLGRRGGARAAGRIGIALGTVDESYALQAAWAKRAGLPPVSGLLAVSFTFWCLWVGGTVAGAFLGELLPPLEPFGLDYALPGIFVGLLGIFADTKPRLYAGLAALAVAAGLTLLGLKLVAILLVPPLFAFALGRWLPGR